VVLLADGNFQKNRLDFSRFSKGSANFSKIDKSRHNLRGENTNKGQKMHLNPHLEKSATKLENRQESALILEKELFKKFHRNAASTRNTFM
jgi:hypothetical protein